jgi:thioredoxin reductase (NADPH)
VTTVRTNGRYREVVTADKSCYAAFAVLTATGAHYRRLDVPGESELIGANVHFCATCDGPFYKGEDVMVIGGGNSAFEESLYLSRLAKSVMILVRSTEIKASPILQEKLAAQENVTIYTNHVVQEFLLKEDQLAGVRVAHRDTGEEELCRPAGVFVFVGVSPNSDFLSGEFERDRRGFLLTDSTLQTSVKGVFAAGDVRAGATAQAAAAAGEGVTAALMIRDYLRE